MTWDQVLMWVVLMGWGAVCVSFVVSSAKATGKKDAS